MPYGRTPRPAARASLAVCAVLTAGLTLLPGPSAAAPNPSIDDVKERVAGLYHEAEIAIERYNTGREGLADARAELRTLRSDLAAQQREVARLRDELGAMVAVQAQSSPLSTASQLLAADDPDAFLSGVAAVQSYNDQQAVLVGAFQREELQLATQQRQMSTRVAAIAKRVAQLRRTKAEVNSKAARAEALLDRLQAERRERVEERLAAAHAAAESTTGRTSSAQLPAPSAASSETDVPASGSAQAAVGYALDQVGEPYVYGAAGPSSWDCSGLTMMAWKAGGVSLPHSAAMQSGMGTAVSTSSLQPGDLVFYYSPVSHVGMYIGDGQLVHAPNPSSSVEVVAVDSMPITGVRRFG